MFAKDTVSHVVKKMEETDCDFLYADGIFVNEQNTNKVVRKWIGGKCARWKVRCGSLPLHPTRYIKREVMMKCGLYDESYKIAADTNLLVNYLYNCHLKVAYLHVDEADENGMESAAIHSSEIHEVYRIPPSPFAKRSFFRKPTRPSLPLRKAPPLTPALSPQERGRKPPSGAQNRYAIRLADHQRSAPSCAGWDRLGIVCCGLQLWAHRLLILG